MLIFSINGYQNSYMILQGHKEGCFQFSLFSSTSHTAHGDAVALMSCSVFPSVQGDVLASLKKGCRVCDWSAHRPLSWPLSHPLPPAGQAWALGVWRPVYIRDRSGGRTRVPLDQPLWTLPLQTQEPHVQPGERPFLALTLTGAYFQSFRQKQTRSK